MDKIKLKAPEGVTSASSNGNSYEAGADGLFEVLVEDAFNLYGLGFGNAPETVEAEESKAKKAKADKAAPQA